MQFITTLQQHGGATGFTTAFLQMIAKDMLIVEPNRKSSKKIAQALDAMRITAKWPPYCSPLARPTSPVSIQEEPEGNEIDWQTMAERI